MCCQSKDDSWVFGFNGNAVTIVSTARLKCADNKPSKVLEVCEEKYLRRLELLVLHEIGHDIVKVQHLVEVKYSNLATGYEFPLGPHCCDNCCALYEIIDVTAPENSCVVIGEEKHFDVGLDDLLERLHPDFFCDKCKSSIVRDDKYK